MNAKNHPGRPWPVLAALAALGALSISAEPALAAGARLPMEQYQGTVGYITGGIGQAEAHLFEQRMSHYRLAVELLQHAGRAEAFTGDARIRIDDAHGREVLNAQAGGPFVLVDLPPGRYSIVASLNRETLRKPVVYVSRGAVARATFEFPPHTD